MEHTTVLNFFIPMNPPTCTHQEKQFRRYGGKIMSYEPEKLKDARSKLTAHLAAHAPAEPFRAPVQLVVKWCFPLTGTHADGDYKTSAPDTDNLDKLLKDVMTDLGYWKNDAHVVVEHIEKFWATLPGLYIRITELPSSGKLLC